jgi:hypothetical protein
MNNDSALGKVIHMDVVPANAPITKNYIDADNFYPADGVVDEEGNLDTIDMYYGNEFDDDFIYNDPQSFADGKEEGNCSSNYDFFEGGITPIEFDLDNNENYDSDFGTEYDADSDFFLNANGRRKRRPSSKRPRKLQARRSAPKRGGKLEKVLSYTPMGMAKKAIDNRFSEEGKQRAEERKKGRRQVVQSLLKNKQAQTKAQIEATKALSMPDTSDALIQQQIMNQTGVDATASNKKKLSTMQIAGISVGILAIGGTIAYFVLRNKK